MPEIAPRLPCPVCLGTTMDKVRVGKQKLEVDHCRRCGGLWLEHGEVQGLRSVAKGELWAQIDARAAAAPARCHDCHAPIDRGAESCPSCGWKNRLACPACDKPMQVENHGSLRLDICRSCKGVWFDHHELGAIWGASFDSALQRRNLPASGYGAGDVAGDVLLHPVFIAPDLLFFGAHAAGAAVSASAQVLANLPGALANTPEAAAGAVEAVAEASGSIFEVVVEIISGIFDNF